MATPSPTEVAAARTAAYGSQTAQLRETAYSTLLAYFLAGQFRDADAERFLTRAVPFVQAARREMSSLTSAYLQRKLRDVGAPLRDPVGPIDTTYLRGVDVRDVYTRPFVSVRMASVTVTFDDAVKAGEDRLKSLIETDLQLAKTQTAQATLSKASRPVLFKRVLKGEHDCVKCILTSTKVYTRKDLLPIHPGCDCDVDVIDDISRFGSESATTLADAHDLVAREFGDDAANASGHGYSDLIAIHHHGEYGPTLTKRGEHFTGPAAVA